MTPERVLLLMAAGLAVLTGLGAVVTKTWRELRKVSRGWDDFNGTPARPGHEATKGVFERLQDQDDRVEHIASVVDKVSQRQEEIGEIAAQAAADVSRAVAELTTNGGSSTKDTAIEARRAAERATELAQEVLATAARTEALLRRHMLNGVEIMEVGERNDRAIIRAIEELGGTVDHHPFPVVDDGSM